MSAVKLAKEIMQFAMAVLPDLLTELGDAAEEKAFEELQKRWKARRKDAETVVPGTNLEDRSEEIDENRSEVDARLAERAAAESPSGASSKESATRKKRGRRGGSS